MTTATNSCAPLRVLVADSPSPVRMALRSAMQAIGGVDVVGEASTSRELVLEAGRLAPDVVLVNPRLPGGDAVEACRTLRAMDRPPTIIALVASFRADEARRLRAAGTDHYVLKAVNSESLGAMLRTVAPESTDRHG